MRSRLLRHLRPVVQEPLQPDIGQGVLRHLLQHVERHRDDVRAELRRLDHVERVSDRCDEDLAVPVVVPEDLEHLADDMHALLAHVVQAADERTHVLRARFRGEDRLIRREDQGRVDLHALRGKGFDRLKALRCHLDLHDDVLVELRELATLLDHLVRLRRRDLQGYRAVDEGEDVLDDLGPLAARLRDERRIRRDAVEDAPGSRFANLLDVRGVQENLHHMRRRPMAGGRYEHFRLAGGVVRRLIVAAIAGLTFFGVVRLEYLYVLGFATGVLTVFFDVSYQAYLPALVPRGQIMEGNSKLEATNTTAQVGGPVLAGLFVEAAGYALPMATDGLTFFFSAGLMARIRKEETTPAPSERKSVAAEIREGLRLVFGDRRLWSIAGCTGTANLFSGALFALFSVYAIS